MENQAENGMETGRTYGLGRVLFGRTIYPIDTKIIHFIYGTVKRNMILLGSIAQEALIVWALPLRSLRTLLF